eukprot:gene17928-21351_t
MAVALVLKVAVVLVTIGLCTSSALFVMLVSLFYTVTQDATTYNNHYVLYVLVSLVLLWIGSSGHSLSVDGALGAYFRKRMRNEVPRWHIIALRFTFVQPYFWGAVNKASYDWLIRAQPIMGGINRMVRELNAQFSPLLKAFGAQFQATGWEDTYLPAAISVGGLVIGIFLLFVFFLPARQFFTFPSNPSWTNEGHFYSWRMKMSSK